MKKTIFAILALSVLLVSSAENALAAPRNRVPVVRHTQVRQQGRINQGVYTGSLTPDEAQSLQTQQQAIQQNKAAAHADGIVTQPERYSLHQQQYQASQNIYTDKHN